ncbi:Hypothetical_protein [Hexamita inflata]|uniref:Hypothetical_protein n=1 Tax=Hexamita inflata TaxID=28002 RepID=A0AA86S1M0_9EUKA|nr:Hypothetical protein HINF_LOCUS64060 [Hexamita inflata]
MSIICIILQKLSLDLKLFKLDSQILYILSKDHGRRNCYSSLNQTCVQLEGVEINTYFQITCNAKSSFSPAETLQMQKRSPCKIFGYVNYTRVCSSQTILWMAMMFGPSPQSCHKVRIISKEKLRHPKYYMLKSEYSMHQYSACTKYGHDIRLCQTIARDFHVARLAQGVRRLCQLMVRIICKSTFSNTLMRNTHLYYCRYLVPCK